MNVFAFVAVSDGSGKVSKADSAQVRKLCMIGKNKKQDSRRSKREARRKATIHDESPAMPELETQDTDYLSPVDNALHSGTNLSDNRDVRISMAALSGMFRHQKNWHVPPVLSWPEPMKVGGQVLSAASQQLLHRCK